jgi:hypothetical protein
MMVGDSVSLEVLTQIASTTGPLGTLIILGGWWARGQFQEVRRTTKTNRKRIVRLERKQGIPIPIEDMPSAEMIT